MPYSHCTDKRENFINQISMMFSKSHFERRKNLRLNLLNASDEKSL